jgi:hypothetical protein
MDRRGVNGGKSGAVLGATLAELDAGEPDKATGRGAGKRGASLLARPAGVTDTTDPRGQLRELPTGGL